MKQQLIEIISRLFGVEAEPIVTRPESNFGDYTTNVALQLAGQIHEPPRSIAEKIAAELKAAGTFKEVLVAGPGFINVFENDNAILANIGKAPERFFEDQRIVFEYSCPNAFKELHTGHLYQTIYGDIAARLMLLGGAILQRTSFGGDVGLHVAKCLWGITAYFGGEHPEKLDEVGNDAFVRSSWISARYVEGSRAYEEDEAAKNDIDNLNKKVYGFHAENDHKSMLAQIYWITRQWSYDYFDAFYDLIKVEKMRYYAESETAPIGLKVVNEQLKKGLLQESNGAVVFMGDESKHLHTRVFITSKGLPTYETKDIGVIWLEQQDYNFDHRFIITGNDQKEYMRVVFAAAQAFQPKLAGKMTHMTNGTVKFANGQKMSSRLGNVTRALDVVSIVREKVKNLTNDPSIIEDLTLGAVKYAFARYTLGNDIAFNIDETVSLTGNSGPYLQYAHARARSILKKLDYNPTAPQTIYHEDRDLIRKLAEFTDIQSEAIRSLRPQIICNYLFELAQEFNRYYEKNRVIGDDKEVHRANLVSTYANTLRDGLGILGISAPNTM
ncbi:MAG TPA: arginine--tRNA ligase [Candidatus Saccharimonadales bacterium]